MDFEERLKETFQNGVSKGMHIGIAIGRFYEKHNITDSIPYELAEEYNNMFEKAMKELVKQYNEYLRNNK